MNKRQGLISFTSFLLGFLLLYFIFWNSINNTIDAFKKYKETINEERDLKTLIDSIPQLEEKFNALKENGSIIIKIIPNERNISNIISQFSDMALSSGLILNSISTSPINNGEVSIDVDIKGSISSLEKFIILMENNLPFIDIKFVDFSGGKIGSQSFTIKSKTYVNMFDANTDIKAKDLLNNLNQALKTDMGFTENKSLLNFKEYGNIPVKIPKGNEVGNDNPYEE